MPIITFSINKQQQKLLDVFVKEDESNNLAAKRLLLDLLEGQQPQQSEALDDLRNQIAALECDRSIPPDWEERLAALEEKLEQTASSPPIPSNLEQRLAALEEKIETVTTPDTSSPTGWEKEAQKLRDMISRVSHQMDIRIEGINRRMSPLGDRLPLPDHLKGLESEIQQAAKGVTVREGFTFEDAKEFVRSVIEGNKYGMHPPKKTKKETMEYLALKQYDCPYDQWNARTFNQVLKDWKFTWE